MRLLSTLRPARVPSGAVKARPPLRLSVEPLEDWAVPAAFAVQNLADSGARSLRQAVLEANATPGTDVIRFTSACSDDLPARGCVSERPL